jgi:hypothetical protein
MMKKVYKFDINKNPYIYIRALSYLFILDVQTYKTFIVYEKECESAPAASPLIVANKNRIFDL